MILVLTWGFVKEGDFGGLETKNPKQTVSGSDFIEGLEKSFFRRWGQLRRACVVLDCLAVPRAQGFGGSYQAFWIRA